MEERKKWKYCIESKGKSNKPDLRELWQYRDLICLFVKRDFISKYKQTLLGPLWAIINPVLTTVVFTIVFGNLAKLPSMDSAKTDQVIIPSFLFYMIGNILWNYFSGVIKEISNIFIRNAQIMGKVYYPRLVSPISFAISGLIKLVIQMTLFMILFAIGLGKGIVAVYPSFTCLLFPMVVVQLMIFSMGVGLTISAVTTKYRDMIMLVDFGLQLWMYATPIAYGLQLVPKKWINVFMLNPMAVIVAAARYLCFGEGYFQPWCYVRSWIIVAAIFLFGIFLFSRTEKNFVDTI